MTGKLAFLKPATGLRETIERFPLSVLCSVLLFLFVVGETHNLHGYNNEQLAHFIALMTCSYFWFGALVLIAEKHGLSVLRYGVLAVAGFMLLVFVTFFAGQSEQRILFLIPAFLLLVMIAPFVTRRGDDDGDFWAYNYVLWSGVGSAVVTAFVLTVGLSIALGSVQYLFDVKAHDLHGDIWAFGMAVFGPVYALFWVPRAASMDEAQYTQACKILVNFILVPLVCIYFLILYAYAAKILIAWEMPRGNLGIMVAGFGAVGVATYLTAWPLRDGGTKLLGLVQRHFFKFLIVPLVLMGVGLSIRIGQYGVTEDRYMAVLALLWLSFITVLFITKRHFPLKIIPASLALLLFLGSFGPWGAVGVSGASQLGRLNEALVRNDLLVNGEVVPAENDIPFTEEKNISSVVGYLVRSGREDKLPGALAQASKAEQNKYNKTKKVMEAMNLQYIADYRTPPNPEDGDEFRLQVEDNTQNVSVLHVNGFDYALNTHHSYGKTWNADIPGDSERPRIQGILKDGIFRVIVDGHEELKLNLKDYASRRLQAGTEKQKEQMALTVENETLSAKLMIFSLSGHRKDGEVTIIDGLTFRLLLDIKDQ